jgi:hypothetical protein
MSSTLSGIETIDYNHYPKKIYELLTTRVLFKTAPTPLSAFFGTQHRWISLFTILEGEVIENSFSTEDYTKAYKLALLQKDDATAAVIMGILLGTCEKEPTDEAW